MKRNLCLTAASSAKSSPDRLSIAFPVLPFKSQIRKFLHLALAIWQLAILPCRTQFTPPGLVGLKNERSQPNDMKAESQIVAPVPETTDPPIQIRKQTDPRRRHSTEFESIRLNSTSFLTTPNSHAPTPKILNPATARNGLPPTNPPLQNSITPNHGTVTG